MLIENTKTVSFRVSATDYRRLREACASMGVPNISELARNATQRFIGESDLGPVHREILDLRARVQSLAADIQDLGKRINVPPLLSR